MDWKVIEEMLSVALKAIYLFIGGWIGWLLIVVTVGDFVPEQVTRAAVSYNASFVNIPNTKETKDNEKAKKSSKEEIKKAIHQDSGQD